MAEKAECTRNHAVLLGLMATVIIVCNGVTYGLLTSQISDGANQRRMIDDRSRTFEVGLAKMDERNASMQKQVAEMSADLKALRSELKRSNP